MSDRVTIDEVADRAGVSVATVSRALRGLTNVSDDTRLRVLDAANDLGYTIDWRASSLAGGRTGVFGLLACNIGTWYTAEVIAGVELRLAQVESDLLVYALDPYEIAAGALDDRLKTRRVDGLIVVDYYLDYLDDGFRQVLEAEPYPIVSIGGCSPKWPSVTIDNRGGAAAAAKHLLAAGHRHLAFVGGAAGPREPKPGPTDRARFEGFRDAASAAGASVIDVAGGYTIDGGAAAYDVVARHDPRPTAVFCASDKMAFGFVSAARADGVMVGRDIAVVGFDGHELSEAFGLTTVHQDARAIGAIAVDALLALTDESSPDPADVEVPVCLRVRSSSQIAT